MVPTPLETIPPASMKDETSTGIHVKFNVYSLYIYDVEVVDNTVYHRIQIPGKSLLNEIGEPELPQI